MPDPAPELSTAADTALTFLESVGHRSEADLYLRLFRRLPRHSFALIVAEAPVVRHAFGSLVEQLHFLERLGLAAPVVVGGFDPVAAAGAAERLLRRLPLVGLEPEVLEARGDRAAEQVKCALEASRLPVLRFSALEGEGSEARFQVVARLSRELGSRKVVVLRRRGALRASRRVTGLAAAASGRLSVVNLRTDAEPLLAPRAMAREDQALLAHAALLLEHGPPGLLVNVTTPLELLRELFTVRGAGTLLKAGTDLERHGSYADVDLTELRALLEASFQRRLREGFFDGAPLLVVRERQYRGAAIVLPGGVAPYLSKFAVEPVAQGEGMGQDLWRALTRELPRMHWRARADNPVARWYATIADAVYRDPHWHYFARGLTPHEVAAAVEEARRMPEDFLEPLEGAP